MNHKYISLLYRLQYGESVSSEPLIKPGVSAVCLNEFGKCNQACLILIDFQRDQMPGGAGGRRGSYLCCIVSVHMQKDGKTVLVWL